MLFLIMTILGGVLGYIYIPVQVVLAVLLGALGGAIVYVIISVAFMLFVFGKISKMFSNRG